MCEIEVIFNDRLIIKNFDYYNDLEVLILNYFLLMR